ncbi:MAG TPA: head GIN domain-containing protein [Tenuifilaceae bacterium]|nr:head GIN domain-containing protein [Tenuifilaceae bacterium]HPE17409.1 head GIN domain-containing protein [Tenuifilaceae bacterium]HPJ46136.1 head GIN domain-containing protein [Tenuifilaceae bacterium]HPQ34539.1 head GIN domain-containing protein [Tenuifilaceae bacterium]
MKIFRLVAAVCISAFSYSVFAQTSTQERNLEPFDKVRITNEVNVILTKGEAEKLRIEAKGIPVEDILTDIDAKTLEITLKRGVYKDIQVDVYLTYVELRDVYVSASGRASIQDVLTGDKVVFSATTNGQIDAKVDLKTVDIIASKAGLIRLEGNIGSYVAKVSTAANLSALDLKADTAFVDVNTKAIAKVIANNLLEADVRSGATLTIGNAPKDKKIKTGFGATIIE